MLLLLLSPLSAGAKTNFEHSLEWTCAKANIVARGKISAVIPLQGPGKSRNLIGLEFRVSEWIKGKSQSKLLHFSVRLPDATKLKSQVNRVEFLVFLYATQQGFSYKGQHYNLWPLRNFGGTQLLVDLSKPGQTMLSATTFKVLRRQSDIVEQCRQTLQALTSLAKKRGQPLPPIKKRWLDVPHKTEVFHALYGGSACYLAVPDLLFPNAKKR